MSDLSSRIERAREHVRPSWTPERERRAELAVERRIRSHARRRIGVVLVAAGLAVALGLLAFLRHRAPAAIARVGHTVQPALFFRLRDGTTVSGLGAGARVDTVSQDADGTTLRLVSGTARFDVAPQHGRHFRVLAGRATVTVIGTRFTVALDRAGVRVDVLRGHVRVDWPEGSVDLLPGQHQVVPPSPPSTAERADAGVLAPSVSAEPALHATAPAPSWRDLAQSGHYARAYEKLAAAPPSAVRDDPGDLLLAADVARLDGHSRAAVGYLERVVRNHSSDARAPLAAFTLGRVLLDDLGQPRRAAHAFATARRLAPNGPLAQDALAQEVEAWSHAGETALAHERAQEYLQRYPNGRRKDLVRRLGGVL